MKSGIKTTEFLLSLLAVALGAVAASGLIAPDTTASKIVGGAVAILGVLGYTWSRATTKNTETKARAAVEIERARASATTGTDAGADSDPTAG